MLDNLFVPPSWNLDDCFGRQYNNTIVDIMWKGAQTGQIESRFNCSNIITHPVAFYALVLKCKFNHTFKSKIRFLIVEFKLWPE